MRKKVDWESIEPEYRAGQLAIKEIARQYNCSDVAIIKKAKKEGWKRDLTKKVQQRVNEKLVNSEVSANLNDDEIIDQASDRAVEIVKIQRNDIQRALSLSQGLFKELEDQNTRSVVIGRGEDRAVVEVPITALEKASPFYALTGALKNLITLQRQAYNIVDKPEDPDEINVNVMALIVEAINLPENCQYIGYPKVPRHR